MIGSHQKVSILVSLFAIEYIHGTRAKKRQKRVRGIAIPKCNWANAGTYPTQAPRSGSRWYRFGTCASPWILMYLRSRENMSSHAGFGSSNCNCGCPLMLGESGAGGLLVLEGERCVSWPSDSAAAAAEASGSIVTTKTKDLFGTTDSIRLLRRPAPEMDYLFRHHGDNCRRDEKIAK